LPAEACGIVSGHRPRSDAAALALGPSTTENCLFGREKQKRRFDFHQERKFGVYLSYKPYFYIN
jgi:hypothetical protein